jgi:hypothetical protein
MEAREAGLARVRADCSKKYKTHPPERDGTFGDREAGMNLERDQPRCSWLVVPVPHPTAFA